MDLVTEARGWLGTPFRHQGRRKGAQGGVDCLGLLIGAADGAGMRVRDVRGRLVAVSTFDRRDYGHLPDGDALCQTLAEVMERVAPEAAQVGDVLLMRFDGNPQHLAIVTDYEGGLGIIHAYAPARKVVEHAFDECWRKAVYACFRMKN
ncbi:MAG: peptidase P60 [Alphaproteobacteria bacterium]|nr:peptidase P60 [Alphaproteobacteria bacterium]